MLYIVATPIGNLEDITLRALETIKNCDIVLAEDTRKTGILLRRFQIKKRMVSFYEHNESKKINAVITQLQQGRKIVLVSSAGTPSISDPGYRLIRECRKRSIPLTSIPGPSSVISALSLSSLPRDKFAFLGYLPRKRSACRTLLERYKTCGLTLVFFESPHRVVKSLNIIREVLGPLAVIALLREMTKKFEEVIEGNVNDVIETFSGKKPKGEFTLLLNLRTE